VKFFTEHQLRAVLHGNPNELAKRLKKWLKKPSTQPEIEFWFRNYFSKGKELPRKKERWEIESQVYIPLIQEALALEKQGKKEQALAIYLRILAVFEPRGTAYYERPAIILEKAGLIDEAIEICRKALNNPYLHRSRSDFEKRLQRLEKKLAKIRTSEKG